MDQLADYLDDEARAELIAQVDLHVGSCQHCRVEVDRLRRTIMIYRCDERVILPVRLEGRLRVALEQAYRDHPCGDDVGGQGEA
jgi:predicted anti-sigma-YlaC factor YlaD